MVMCYFKVKVTEDAVFLRRVNNFLFIFIGVVDAFAFLRRVNNFLFIFISVVDASLQLFLRP